MQHNNNTLINIKNYVLLILQQSKVYSYINSVIGFFDKEKYFV